MVGPRGPWEWWGPRDWEEGSDARVEGGRGGLGGSRPDLEVEGKLPDGGWGRGGGPETRPNGLSAEGMKQRLVDESWPRRGKTRGGGWGRPQAAGRAESTRSPGAGSLRESGPARWVRNDGGGGGGERSGGGVPTRSQEQRGQEVRKAEGVKPHGLVTSPRPRGSPHPGRPPPTLGR